MRYKSLLLILVLFLIFLPTRMSLDYPITLSEVKEAYTSYSIIKIGKDTNGEPPGIFFQADNDYLSTLGVYLRIPFIYILGLNNSSVRLPGILIGLLTLYVFYTLARLLLPKNISIISTLLLGFSPYLIQINIFNFGGTLTLLNFLLAFYFYRKKNTFTFLLFCVLAGLSSLSALPAILVLVISYYYVNGEKRKVYYCVTTALIIFAVLLKTNPQLGNFLVRESIVRDLLPSSYTFEIDRRLSFGQIISSPLITPKFNYNRLAFNKAYFGLTEFLKELIRPFDYEILTSSFQAQTILAKERIDSVALPKVFFWEAPLIILGVIIFLKLKYKNLKILFLAVAASLGIFKESSFYLALPIIVWLNSLTLDYLLQIRRTTLGRVVLVILVLLFLGSYSDFIYRLRTQKYSWGEPNDVAQYQIWNFINKEGVDKGRTVVTDRLGDPAFYYLFYKRIDPYFFQQNKILSQTLIAGRTRILKVGEVEFRSFKYYDSPKGENEIWVGLPGEFVGEKKDFSTIEHVPSGQIVGKIRSVKQASKLFGDELWFVTPNSE